MHIQDTSVNLLPIFGKDDFGMFLVHQGQVLLSTVTRTDVHRIYLSKE